MTKQQTAQTFAAVRARLNQAWQARDPQAAAAAIVAAGRDAHRAMDYAASLGFIPEYYANSIRVHLPE